MQVDKKNLEDILKDMSKEELIEMIKYFENYTSVTKDDDEAYILAYLYDESCSISKEQIMIYLSHSTYIYENERFGDFFEHFKLTPDDVTSLIINGTNEDWEKMFKRN